MVETFEPIAPVTWLYLQRAWGSAYWIHRNGGCWSARRKDQRGMFTATSAEDLLTKIRDDYARCKVPR